MTLGRRKAHTADYTHPSITGGFMRTRRPQKVMLALIAVAVSASLISVLLDENGKWGDLRQAAANVLWIVFLLSVLGLVITGIRVLVARRNSSQETA